MFDSATLIAYAAASVVIILAPGPAQALVVARSISEGRRSGIMTALGLNVATIVHTVAAALGLSAILATSATDFAVVKYLGAGYLLYLGIKALLDKADLSAATNGGERTAPSQAFTKAVATGILNPKVALFFLAFVPQFVNPQHGSVFLQFLVLGFILAVMDIVYESLLALMAGAFGQWFAGRPRLAVWRQRTTGAVFVALAARLALTSRK